MSNKIRKKRIYRKPQWPKKKYVLNAKYTIDYSEALEPLFGLDVEEYFAQLLSEELAKEKLSVGKSPISYTTHLLGS